MKMKNVISKLLWVVVACMAVVAYAATKGDQSPDMKYGAVNVLNSAATAIPDMGAANAVLIQNLGPNAIYCGNTSGVLTTTGVQVPANGGVLTIDIVQISGATIKPKIYCLAATADQSSPNNTRYMRVK